MLYLWAFPDMPSAYALNTDIKHLEGRRVRESCMASCNLGKKAVPTAPFLPICGLNGLQLENIHVPTHKEGTCYKI